MNLMQSVCLIGQHAWPNTRHTRTHSCLICRHLQNDTPKETIRPCVTWTTSMSENDLLSTGRFRVARLFHSTGFSYSQSKEIGLYLQRIQMGPVVDPSCDFPKDSVVVVVAGPETEIHEVKKAVSAPLAKLVLIIVGDTGCPPDILAGVALRCVPRAEKGYLFLFPDFRSLRPVLCRLCSEGGRTSSAQLMRAGVVVHQLTSGSSLEDPLLI